jgi:hypothetical protein
VSLAVNGASAGVKDNSTGPVTSTEAVAGSAATASLTVTAPPVPPPPGNEFKIGHASASAKNGVVTFDLTLAGAGRVTVLETAANDTLAAADTAQRPGTHRYTFGRLSRAITHAGSYHLRVSPGASGKRALRRHRRGFSINLWVTFTPKSGKPRTHALLNLRLRP